MVLFTSKTRLYYFTLMQAILTHFLMSLKGPIGTKGDKGELGPNGIKGEMGYQGLKGDRGKT